MSETKNQSSYKKLFSNTLVFAIGSFSSKVLVLLLVPIYTNYLSRAELGVTDVLTQIANWIIPLVTMTITEAIIRFGLDKAYDKVKVFTLGNLICFFGLAVFGILLPIVSLTGIADKYIGGYCIILYVYVFTSSMKSLYSTFVRAMEQVKLFAFNGILTTFFTLFWTAMFYMVLPESFLGEGTGIEAIDQLEVWTQRAGVDIIKHNEGSDPASVVFDALAAAKARQADVVICDTAGRLHNKKNLMDELKKISRIVHQQAEGCALEVLLALDATTGQNAVNQAKQFNEVADITGIILTKLDGTAKGGIIISITDDLKVPVKLVTVGEKIDDIQPFSSRDFVEALFE